MPDIFISYRREDTSGYAGQVYDQLSAHFGADHVFMDVAAIGPGSDFVDTIENKVGTCDALVAIVGKNWLTIRNEQNRVRLGSPEDFVSIEVAARSNGMWRSFQFWWAARRCRFHTNCRNRSSC
jgi:hypothetical protein